MLNSKVCSSLPSSLAVVAVALSSTGHESSQPRVLVKSLLFEGVALVGPLSLLSKVFLLFSAFLFPGRSRRGRFRSTAARAPWREFISRFRPVSEFNLACLPLGVLVARHMINGKAGR